MMMNTGAGQADRVTLMMPLCVIIKVTPSVALAPVFIIIWGFDSGPKIVVAALTVFYAALVNSMTGFKDVDRDTLELLHSVGRVAVGDLPPPPSTERNTALVRRSQDLRTARHPRRRVRRDEQLPPRARQHHSAVRSQHPHGSPLGAIFVLMFIGIVLVSLVSVMERRSLRWHVSNRD